MSKPKSKRGGARPGAGRKPKDPAKKKISRSVCLTEAAWEWIDCRAAAMGRSRSGQIQAWAERLPIL